MRGTKVQLTGFRVGERESRRFSRIVVVIPARVEVLAVSRRLVSSAMPGALVNIGCGGGRVRVRWELPPRTRLFISLPGGMPSLRLLAEVRWAARPSGRRVEPAEYGVRWVEPLSSCVLQRALLRQGLEGGWEETHVRGARA